MIQQVRIGQQWLENLLQLMGFPASVKIGKVEGNDESSSYWLIIDESLLSEDKIKLLIGTKGETIDTIQYLVNTHLNIGSKGQQNYFTIELNGYRLARSAELEALAREAAEEVRTTGKAVELKSLSSAERRQIHAFFEDCEDITTESRGQEPDRKLFIRPR